MPLPRSELRNLGEEDVVRAQPQLRAYALNVGVRYARRVEPGEVDPWTVEADDLAGGGEAERYRSITVLLVENTQRIGPRGRRTF